MRQTDDSTLDGYEAFSDISDATIAAVRADMAHNPKDSLTLFRELSSVNRDVSLAVLSAARQASADQKSPERAFIEGATFIIRLLAKQGKANKLHSVLFPLNFGDADASDPLLGCEQPAGRPKPGRAPAQP